MNVAVITGASSGMGKWFAVYSKRYFKEIDKILLIGRDKDRLEKVKNKIKIPCDIYSMDINDNTNISILRNDIINHGYNIKLLVNSAGMGIIGNFNDININDCQDMIRTNIESLTKITRICLDYMGQESYIINLASSAAFVPQAGFAVYAASKSYVLSLSMALGRELRKRHIYVTAVCPGTVKTPFIKTAEKYQKIKSFKKLFMANERAVVIKALEDAKKHKSKSIYGIWMKCFGLICKIFPAKFILMFMK